MKYLTNEVKIALVAIVGIVVMFIGLQYLKGLNIFSSDNCYYARFNDVSGLTASCPVYAYGYRVGVVTKIMYDYKNPENIIAAMNIDSELGVPRNSTVEIASDLLGNVKLELKFGPNPTEMLSKGDTIEGNIQRGTMEKASNMIPQIEKMLPKLDSILASVNTLLADPALGNTMHNVDHISSNLATTTQELKQLTASLNHQMPQMLDKANGVLANTEGLTRQLNSIDVAATMDKVDMTLANVQQMTEALNSKNGTLGLLMHDAELYKNMNATMRDADALMIDLKANPKRYVHFSVFGKKNNQQ
jgi:phospholipid/cholesterol/gamma-HCH transport system substrate-binding protein